MTTYKPSVEISEDHKLCYVEDGRAFFVAAEPGRVYGDYWDSAPYEMNAGYPYGILRPSGPPEDIKGDALRVLAFDPANVLTPEQMFGYNHSTFTVNDINQNAVPWLTEVAWTSAYHDLVRGQENPEQMTLDAGSSMVEFMEFMTAIGSTVFVPLVAVNQ